LRRSGYGHEFVCVDSGGTIEVLDGDRARIDRFDSNGRLLGALELDTHDGGRLFSLAIASNGDRLIDRWAAEVPGMLWVSRAGAWIGTFAPHYAGGRVFTVGSSARIAPDGRTWVSDDYALLRLDEQGTVDRILGEAPDPSALGEVERAYIDSRGRALIADRRTHAVHVFDATGERIAICEVPPSELPPYPSVGSIAVSADEDVHVCIGSWRESPYAVFDSSGERRGSESSAGRELFQPSQPLCWAVAWNSIRLVEANGALRREIRRSSSDRWLDIDDDFGSVAPDGSLAVVSRGELDVFSPEGEPVASIELPFDARRADIAMAQGVAFLLADGRLWSIDVTKREARSALLGSELPRDVWTGISWCEALSELRILDATSKSVLRYRVSR
jgi:hypothetical protein